MHTQVRVDFPMPCIHKYG